ncbi:MAG: folylpolyglutamate synthase/dihydrofolate synthase family protein [Anaerocolumna sp.]
MTYEEASGFLKSSEQYGSVLGLESMGTLLERLGNPQDRLKFVHIAGTNGKGSTAAYIATILAAAGYHVGRYISPSVFSYFEKIQISWSGQIGGENPTVITKYIGETEVSGCVSKIKNICESMTAEGLPHPTVFEIETAMAMLYFLSEKCNIVVLEVGLGGRLDATNVISTAECAVITSISMDHMHLLGDTIGQIALEKAGIIKPQIPVVSYGQEAAAKKIIESVSLSNHAVLTTADFSKIKIEIQTTDETVFSYGDRQNLKIKLLGENQVKNAVVAILAIDTLISLGYLISESDIRNGLFQTIWRGRFELVKDKPLFVIDGAHNEDAAISLEKNINLYFSNKRILFIIGVLADKDYDAVLKHTGLYADRIFTITPNNIRGLQSDKLAETARKYCNQVMNAGTVSRAVKLAYDNAVEDDVIIAFGSLSYLKEVYDELGVVLP